MKLMKKRNVIRYNNGSLDTIEDDMIIEQPFTIFFNGEELLTLLCSPSNLEYLAVGFLISEGLIKKPSDILSLRLFQDKGIIEVETGNKDNLSKELFGKRTITTGCGKGTSFYNVLDSFQTKTVPADFKLWAEDILTMMGEFNKASEAFQKTGGVHSAGLSDGKIIILFHEDVGRHNAIDKIIGEAVMKKICLKDKILITSGRISSEMLIKAAKMEIPIIVSRSAPTDLAVELGEELGITIAGFVRGIRMNVYSAWNRIVY